MREEQGQEFKEKWPRQEQFLSIVRSQVEFCIRRAFPDNIIRARAPLMGRM
jgi:hypothetical protein